MGVTRTRPLPLHDAAEIVRAAALYVDFPAGQVTEVRAVDAAGRGDHYETIWAGWFDNPEALPAALGQLGTAGGVFILPNPVNPALLARRVNRLAAVRGKSTPLTADKDVLRRRWLLVDADPCRPAGVSATDAEHEAALAVAAGIREALYEEDWPRPLFVDSGNGGHVDFPIDEPCDDGGLVAAVLTKLNERFGTTLVKIDGTAANPARPWKLPGTLACKGDDAAAIGRPHRPSRIIEAPDVLEPVPHELLVRLAGHTPKAISLPSPPKVNGNGNLAGLAAGPQRFSIDTWMAAHEPDARGPESFSPNSGGTGRKWVLPACPFDPSHTNASACVFEFPSGAVDFTCLHDSCRGRTWHDLRRLREPGFDPHRREREHPPRQNGSGYGGSQPPASEDEPADDLPPFITAGELLAGSPAMRPPVIHNLLRRGEVVFSRQQVPDEADEEENDEVDLGPDEPEDQEELTAPEPLRASSHRVGEQARRMMAVEDRMQRTTDDVFLALFGTAHEHAQQLATMWEAFARFCRTRVGVSPETMLDAWGFPISKDFTDMLTRYEHVKPEPAKVDEYFGLITSTWDQRFRE